MSLCMCAWVGCGWGGRNYFADPSGMCTQCQSNSEFLRTLAIAIFVGAVGAAITVK